ncbi:unnamed protein product [Mytilus edulis]|uniref:Uncharacterized protein n=1 Tax=Mytilus edulis TaxID=6550 RepID=A0A8S3PWF3_MYTED|nr:unnamed protein product [Mytilus edulis]
MKIEEMLNICIQQKQTQVILNTLNCKNKSVRDNPYVNSTKKLLEDIAMEGENLCAKKTSMISNITEDKTISKEKKVDRKKKIPTINGQRNDQHLALTHPENQQGLRKVATSNAQRPLESEILNNTHLSSSNTSHKERSDDTESSHSSEQSTYDSSDETILKYLPAVDSIELHST